MCHGTSESYCSYVFFLRVMKGVFFCNLYLRSCLSVCVCVFLGERCFFVFYVVNAVCLPAFSFGCHGRCLLFFVVVIFILKLFVCLAFCILCSESCLLACVFLGVMKGVCCLSQIRRWCFVRAMSPRGFPTFHIHQRIHTLI